MEAAVSEFDSKFEQTFDRIEKCIDRCAAESDRRMIRWVVGTGVGMVVASGGIIVGAVAFLLKALPVVLH